MPEGEPPTVRWATSDDLDRLESRLTSKIEGNSQRGWQVATLFVAGLSPVLTLATLLFAVKGGVPS